MVKPNSISVCVDVGSLRDTNNVKFGWIASDGNEGTSIDALAVHLTELQASGISVALGFECPSWIPVPSDSKDIGAQRDGEDGFPWSAGAGAGTLATGLAQISWILRRLANTAPAVSITTSRDVWVAEPNHVWLLWEAFVAGDRKPNYGTANGHIADARAGLYAFESNEINHPETSPHEAVNLLVALADWAGLPIRQDERRRALPIFGPRHRNLRDATARGTVAASAGVWLSEDVETDPDPWRPHVYVPDISDNYNCEICGGYEFGLIHIEP